VHFESFGAGWHTDLTKQLKLAEVREHTAAYGALPDLSKVDTGERDVCFTWNGTTSGVRVPNADWISAERKGLTLNDATSAVFSQAVDFAKCDATTFSWQKVLGGEGAHGMLILSPRARERLESHAPKWPLPKVFRLAKKGKLEDGLFRGETINTPSMLCVEDYLDALTWAEKSGGVAGLTQLLGGKPLGQRLLRDLPPHDPGHPAGQRDDQHHTAYGHRQHVCPCAVQRLNEIYDQPCTHCTIDFVRRLCPIGRRSAGH
jgi:phosphoserine aminotransferase